VNGRDSEDDGLWESGNRIEFFTLLVAAFSGLIFLVAGDTSGDTGSTPDGMDFVLIISDDFVRLNLLLSVGSVGGSKLLMPRAIRF
jgi:hypothetical protein